MTALENVEMPMILSGKLSQPERKQRAKGMYHHSESQIMFIRKNKE